MSHFTQHHEFYDQAIRLSDAEKKDPYAVLDNFFTDYSLSEIREIHQQADQACLSTDTPPFDDPDKRDQVISYRTQEERALEAALILLQRKEMFSKPLERNPPPNEKRSPDDPIELDDVIKRVMDLQLKLGELTKIVVVAWCEKCKRSLRP